MLSMVGPGRSTWFKGGANSNRARALTAKRHQLAGILPQNRGDSRIVDDTKTFVDGWAHILIRSIELNARSRGLGLSGG